MSYTIDVYRGNLRATRKLGDFLLYVSFFPQLVAGPIERATHLLPQVEKSRRIDANGLTDGAQINSHFIAVWMQKAGLTSGQ